MRYGVSYCDLEKIIKERGVTVDHTTLNRWVIRFLQLLPKDYAKEAARVELEAMEKLCIYFNCTVGDLFEFISDEPTTINSVNTPE